MASRVDISPTIVDALYEEALDLADETRTAFELSGRLDAAGEEADLAGIALSCEALRTTTRMMHGIAWLLNQRAFFSGELSASQLRRHGRLPPDEAAGDPAQLALLDQPLHDLSERTRDFYQRLARLDRAWRKYHAMEPEVVHLLYDRLDRAIGRF